MKYDVCRSRVTVRGSPLRILHELFDIKCIRDLWFDTLREGTRVRQKVLNAGGGNWRRWRPSRRWRDRVAQSKGKRDRARTVCCAGGWAPATGAAHSIRKRCAIIESEIINRNEDHDYISVHAINRKTMSYPYDETQVNNYLYIIFILK